MKIKLLMPYFGALPKWFKLYVATCEKNESITWQFFSDQIAPSYLPGNVQWTQMALSEFYALACEKLSFDVQEFPSFKICDFRPAFGEIFDEFIEKFDYWGWGDVDVFYGDLANAFKKAKLRNYDVFGIRSEFFPGELTILKNRAEVTHLFRESRDYHRVLTTNNNFNFCELGFVSGLKPERKVQSFTETVCKAGLEGRVRIKLCDLGHNDRKTPRKLVGFYWENGKLWDTNTGSETLLYHFLDLKKNPSFAIPDLTALRSIERFYVHAGGVDIKTSFAKPKIRPFRLLVDKLHRRARWYRAQRRLAKLVSVS